MKSVRYEMILRAEEPIAHFSETIDNEAIFARESVRAPGGGFVQIPYIQANSLRHQLREASVFAALDAAGLLGQEVLASDAALRFLFGGGSLSGRGGKGFNLDEYARMCDLFPPLSLFGGSASNRILPGKLSIGPGRLVCAEQRLTEWARSWAEGAGERLDPARSHLDVITNVRMDPTLNPSKRALLTPSARANTEAWLLASETAHEKDDAIARDENKSSMMPYSYETLQRGSLFHWQVCATLDTELEEDTFLAVLGTYLANARVGGKRGLMMGHIVPVAASQMTLSRPSESVVTMEIGGRVGSLFRAHVRERSDALREWLSRVAA